MAAHIMRILRVRYVSFPIAKTEKGDLYIKFIKDQDNYELVLDAVPLSMLEYDNRELNSLILKYLYPEPILSAPEAIAVIQKESKEVKRGRPKKHGNINAKKSSA